MPKTLILTLSFAYRQYDVRIARKIIELCARIDLASKHDYMSVRASVSWPAEALLNYYLQFKTRRIAYIKIKCACRLNDNYLRKWYEEITLINRVTRIFTGK